MSISVVIPAYNAEVFIAEAVESVLRQNGPIAEFIVIDDGSTDGTLSALKSYGAQIRIVEQPNQGESRARNRGLECATGEWILFLDADDRLADGMLGRVASTVTERPECGVLYGGITFFGGELKTYSSGLSVIDVDGDALPAIVRGKTLIPGQFVVRGDLVERLGGFDESMQFGEDWEFLLRLASSTRFHHVPEVFLEKRVHPGMQSFSKDRPDVYLQRMQILRKVFGDEADQVMKKHLSRRVIADWYRSHAFSYADSDNGDAAVRQMLKSLRKWPFQPTLYLWCANRFLRKRD